MNNQMKAKMIAKKIKTQFPDYPEAFLMFSIVECALTDSVMTIGIYQKGKLKGEEMIQDLIDRASAIRYLSSDMPHCEMCGVSSYWVRGLISKLDMLPATH